MSDVLTFDEVRYTFIWRIPAYDHGNPTGRSIGLARCELCGAAVMFDVSDPVAEFSDPMTAHSAWHKKHGDIERARDRADALAARLAEVDDREHLA